MTERKVGNRVTEMQRRRTSKISNRKYDQPVAQDGWSGRSVSAKIKMGQNDVLLPKERTLKEEQTTTIRVGYAVLISEENEKCQRKKVKRVYHNKKQNSTINKSQHQERKRYHKDPPEKTQDRRLRRKKSAKDNSILQQNLRESSYWRNPNTHGGGGMKIRTRYVESCGLGTPISNNKRAYQHQNCSESPEFLK